MAVCDFYGCLLYNCHNTGACVLSKLNITFNVCKTYVFIKKKIKKNSLKFLNGFIFVQFTKKEVWLNFCFMVLQHSLGHFGRGQLP